MNYLVIDTETTGLSPRIHEMIEFAAIYIEDGEKRHDFCFHIHPEYIERANPIALEINGYDIKNPRPAIPQRSGAKRINKILQGCKEGTIIVGHNVNFDLRFIAILLSRFGLRGLYPKLVLDTVPLSKSLYPELKSVKLSNVCKHLNLKQRNAHTALSDCEDVMNIINGVNINPSDLENLDLWKLIDQYGDLSD